ncbi:LYR motif-containing protein 5A-like protein [Catenaria anguillulae PL171]|uniref:LYR motif-containing protein 5A-like protein n=1 Tax=Catenaria anguillulae PL171 TaxID=765915 RepID=A0A1Y2HZD1_9FUNG|nr:LYR motif-containing protein 5A-like protein [Catenaria anguillulae PL171]
MYASWLSHSSPRNPAMSTPLRSRVIHAYKELLFLGRDYPHPEGFPWFRRKLKSAFQKNAHLTDEHEIKQALLRADFVKKEIEALYYLRKYRSVQKRYDQL